MHGLGQPVIPLFSHSSLTECCPCAKSSGRKLYLRCLLDVNDKYETINLYNKLHVFEIVQKSSISYKSKLENF